MPTMVFARVILVLALSGGAAAVPAASDCNVTLSRQLSSHGCEGLYGCFAHNNSMWVKSGCRAIFECNGVENVKCDPCDPACPGGTPSISVCKCMPAPPAPPPPPSPPGAKYMLLDDRNVISSTAEFVLGQVEKSPHGAMIKEEREYEMRFDNMQPNVWYDPAEQPGRKKWRAWYSAFTTCSKDKSTVPFCNNAPQQCGTTNQKGGSRGSGFLYAESDDGVTWEKPALGLQKFKGQDTNMIDFAATSRGYGGMTTGIYLDETATDPSQRYKISTGTNGNGGIATSADGIHWNNTKDLEEETHARWDAPKNVVWDHERRQWLLYLRMKPTEGGKRIQAFSHSLTEEFMGEWAPAMPTGLNTSGV